jgi:cardiolipin synthase
MAPVLQKQMNNAKSQASDWRQYSLYPGGFTDGNRVTLLIDGNQSFSAMLDAISNAQSTILMESYIFNNDQTGRIFRDTLSFKARSGVQVFLMVDGVGTVNVPYSFFESLIDSNVNFFIYHPVVPWKRGFNILRRNHRKLLVVDGRIGFAGGLNIADEWRDTESGGEGWHDIHIKIEGPAVNELSRLSMATWRKYKKIHFDNRLFMPKIFPEGDTLAEVVGSYEKKKRKAIRKSYYHAIKKAVDYIYIANAYFLPDYGFRMALKKAVKRGVDVRVMVPAHGDIYMVEMASRAIYGSLLKNGIKVYLWKEAILHAKIAIIDDMWATVGSYNLDRRSLAMNLEANINIAGKIFAGRLRQVFERDLKSCRELDLKSWKKRYWILKLVEKFFFMFRKFL